MRKSTSRSKVRVATAAGLTTGAVAAALLVAPAAASAATTVYPPVVAVGDLVTITDTEVSFSSGTNGTASRAVILTSPGTTTPVCSATYPTTSTTIVAAEQTAGSISTSKTVTFKVPTAAVAGTNGLAKRYVACFYAPTGSTAREGNQNGYPFYVGTAPTLNPTFGLTGTANTVTLTAATNVFTGVTALGAQYTTEPCPAAYGTPAAGTTGTPTRTGDASATVTVPATLTSTSGNTRYNLCVYNGTLAASTLVTIGSYAVTQLVLSQGTGPWQGGNSLDITSPNQVLAGIDSPGVNLTAAACPAKYESTDTVGTSLVADVRKISNSRFAFTVPALRSSAPAAPPTAQPVWNVCLYGGTDDGASDLVANIPYTITTLHTATEVAPKAGPALGGSKIVVSGTAFPTDGTLTATLGGMALTGVKVLSPTAFEAITPAHAPGNNMALTVTTAAGTFLLTNAYSFTSALIVDPNTAPNTRTVNVVIKGVGFQSANFNAAGTALTLTGSHFYLVEGVYAGNEGDAASGVRANPPVAECRNVLVLKDTEAICSLNLARRLDAEGVDYLVPAAPAEAGTIGTPAVTTIGSTVTSRVIRSSAALFTRDHEGLTIYEATPTNFAPGTRIVDVISPTVAVISAPAQATGTGITLALLPPTARTVTVTTGNASTALGAPAVDTFLTSDDERYIVGPNIALGIKLNSITDGDTAVLSAVSGGTGSTASANLLSMNVPVPEGAYNMTYVSNGALNASSTDPNYVQSTVSSTSTFAVSSF
ncbi:IPT/TIG domain-containing protein [Actinoplanes sp. NPDC051470]|uniref:IPT/TIG domain-containing protein n=1 Tax=Actinoplanes sp. NPDC051470 TaxID=3157224 RepID=UPI00343E8647